MAHASAANNIALTTAVTTIYDPATAAASTLKGTTILIRNHSDSSSAVRVNVAGLHAAGEYYEIPAGEKEAFRSGDDDLGVVTVKAVSTATISHAIISTVGMAR
jgi:hypothetical protein